MNIALGDLHRVNNDVQFDQESGPLYLLDWDFREYLRWYPFSLDVFLYFVPVVIAVGEVRLVCFFRETKCDSFLNLFWRGLFLLYCSLR